MCEVERPAESASLAPSWWPWPDFDARTTILPWAAILVDEPQGVEIRVEHAAVSPDHLCIWVETRNGNEEWSPATLERSGADIHMVASLPGGIILRSVGEWETKDPTQSGGDSAGYSMRDYGVTDGSTGGGVIVISPPPTSGALTLGFHWEKAGVDWVEVTFHLDRTDSP